MPYIPKQEWDALKEKVRTDTQQSRPVVEKLIRALWTMGELK